MSQLTDRASALRAFFRLVNADSSDADLIEHDSTTLEGAYHLLQQGVWDAQLYLIGCGAGSRWAKTSSALTFSGSDPDQYTALPSDFLKLDADDEKSGLRSGTIGWGRQVPFERRFDFRGQFFYIRGNEGEEDSEGGLRLYLCVGASPPSGLVADYYYRHGTLADDSGGTSGALDLPLEDRDLAVAFAAVRATAETWFVGGESEMARLDRHLDFLKGQAWRRSSPSRVPTRVPVKTVIGNRWYI